MWVLILGLCLFYGVHLVPSLNLKAQLITKIGKQPYMGGFSLLAGLGLGLMIYGKSIAGFIPVWQPVLGAHWLPIIFMWPALILLSWAYLPCNMKAKLRHPMLLGILLFSISHLIANGDLGSILLIGSFGLFALINIIMVNRREAPAKAKPKAVGWDVLGVIMGTVAYALVFMFHQTMIGVAIQV